MVENKNAPKGEYKGVTGGNEVKLCLGEVLSFIEHCRELLKPLTSWFGR